MDLDGVRRSLEARLDALLRRVEKIESDLRNPGSRSLDERPIELENEEVLERLDETERREIADIRRALGRVRAGTYGTCERCGGEIGARRLEALPYTSLCVSCAS